MVDKVLISEIKAETISFQILLTAVLNDKEKTQKHYVSEFNAVQ